jgi:hypothetical protein
MKTENLFDEVRKRQRLLKTVKVQVRVSEATYDDLKTIAQETNSDISKASRHLIEFALANYR